MLEVIYREFIPNQENETAESVIKKLEALETCQCAYTYKNGRDTIVRALFFEDFEEKEQL